MNSKTNLFTLSYKVGDIKYYAICLDGGIYLTKKEDGGKTLTVSQEDKTVLREILNEIQRRKYKFIGYIDYEGRRFKKYLNLLDGLLYFTTIQDGKEVACSYEGYPSLYNQANFARNLKMSGESIGGGQDNNEWGMLQNLDTQENETEIGQPGEKLNEDEMPLELAKSLDETAEKLSRKAPWIKKITKMFVPIMLGASIAVSMTACGDTNQNAVSEVDPDSAVIYQIDGPGKDELNPGAIRDILNDNDFDRRTIDDVIEDYETRLGTSSSHVKTETNLGSEKAKQALDAIESNADLSESDRAFLQEMFAPWLAVNADYLDENCVERLAKLKIVYNTEEGAAQEYGVLGFTGTLQDDGTIFRYAIKHNGETGLLGIVINDVDPGGMEARSTLTHEFIHVLTPNWSEGMVELHNPNKDKSSPYRPQQLAMAMLEEVYGEDNLKKAFLDDDTLSTLAESEDEANLFLGILYRMSAGAGKYRVGLADLFEPLGELYEAKHPGEDVSENLVFNLCKDIFNGTNDTGIAEEGETIDYFLYKGDKLYVACGRHVASEYNPFLGTLGLDEHRFADLSRLVPVR